ncbi:phage/plasmid primase, P4 family [Neptuniibacter sp.]|uniref:DNA primase family protein n=1 Tax=Neptuniibacter sp. TaxID=1962643 RepID=UPI00262436B1|nr:phage/plasmid primase, P4 family [Neptuniibacter sp.]MCP4596222.1 hypothetical protein [Neptuniibacter sp.]
MKTNIPNQFVIYQSNVFPAMLDVLAKELGVSADALQAPGIGFNPKNQSWIFPERDTKGSIIGLMERFQDGKKFMVKGSKRGLTFKPQSGGRDTSNRLWKPVTWSGPCSICGKPDWCLVSVDSAGVPGAACCNRISTGSSKKLPGGGFLHILNPENKSVHGDQALLPPSEHPIFVVEGASDVAAITDLGLVGVGKPSAEGGIKLLTELLSGYDVVVMGENDAGAGKRGMETTATVLAQVCTSAVTTLPLKGFKDTRKWLHGGLTRDTLLSHVKEYGEQVQKSDDVFDNDIPATIAEVFLTRHKTKDGALVLRSYRSQWVEFIDGCYRNLDTDVLRGQIYRFLEGKKVKKCSGGEFTLEPYKPSRSRVNDIVDAFNKQCPVDIDPPAWLDGREDLDPTDLIVFNNGVLDVKQYVQGIHELKRPDPMFFSLSSVPHDLNRTLVSPLWLEFLSDVFNDDQQRIDLLQEWFGYNLVPDMSFEKFMIFVGRPRSGKGTILAALAAMLGSDQVCSTNLRTLCGSFGYQPMLGKLAAFMGDVRTPRYGDLGTALERILQIVGKDSVSINRKNLPILSNIQLCCRFTIALNDFPLLPDYANALAPRLLLLDFPNSYQGIEDRTLKPRLEAEAGNIIPWALEGLKRLRLNDRFTDPKSSSKAVDSLRDVISPITTFVRAWCDLEDGVEIEQDELYDAWKIWGRKQGVQGGTTAQFIHQLSNLYSTLVVGGFIVRGIALKPDVADKMLRSM